MRVVLLVAFLLFATSNVAICAVEVLRTTIIGDISVTVVRAPDGWLIDIGRTDPDRSADQIRYNADGVDISDRVLGAPPVIDVIYAFRGVPAPDQCIYKTMLDALLVSGGAPFVAFSDQENELCAELGIVPWGAMTKFTAPDAYSRLLVVEVLGNGNASSLPLASGRVSATMELRPDTFADRPQMALLLSKFFRAHVNGDFHFIGDQIVRPESTIQAHLFRSGNLLGSVDVHRPSLAEWFRAYQYWIWVGAGFLLLALAALFWRTGPPLREIVVGYGPNVDYSLGAGGHGPVARITRYKNGAVHIERLASVEAILINGEALKRRRKISPSDEISVAGKLLKLV